MSEEMSCQEFHRAAGASRRTLLKAVGAVGAGAVLNQTFGTAFRQTAFAAAPAPEILVVLSLRGGVDGLGMVVPHGDQGYFAARPTTSVPRSTLLGTDAMFGLHPAMAPLSWLWDSGELAAVHAVGMSTVTRSHFAAMELLEEAAPGSTSRVGWVNRMVGLDAFDAPLEAVQMGGSYPPTLITGPAPTLATRQVRDLQLSDLNGTTVWSQRRRAQLEMSWGAADSPFTVPGRHAITVSDAVDGMAEASAPLVPYPTDVYGKDLGEALADSARMIKANVGVNVVTIDHGSWDMHSGYGTVDIGRMRDMVGGLARALSAFMQDLGPLRTNVTVVTVSEFGRRVRENGNNGLDHGWGNVMLLLGGSVRGGRYYGTWPGVRSMDLVDGDLKVTTDYRDVFAEVIAHKFPDRSISSIFPGLTPTPLGVMRTA